MLIDGTGKGAISLHWIFLLLLVSWWSSVYASWWVLSRMQLSAIHADTHQCLSVSGLDKKQRTLCLKHPDMLPCVSRGARMGVRECQSQFRDRRWNCSTVDTGSHVFGKVTEKVGSRESAFVYAISSAGVVYATSKSCSKGDVSNCACDSVKHKGIRKDAEGDFTWKGCSSFIKFGIKFARRFIDAPEGTTKDARVLMNLHNNRAGRKSVRKFTKTMCKCHGVSGSCEVRSCWLTLKNFREVGAYLKSQYDGAVRVTLDQTGTLVADEGRKPFTEFDLVYFESSPDYCSIDKSIGTLGTAGRECKKNSQSPAGCDVMCCGMGYDTSRIEVVKKCNCKFYWCCYVKCDECKKIKDVHTCKASSTNRYARDSFIG